VTLRLHRAFIALAWPEKKPNMDITFTCKCGQEIVIDEAGAGITVDCPGCGKPIYVPSKQPPKAKDIPVRVETPLAKLMAKQGETSSPKKSIHPTPEAVAQAVRLKRQSNAKERTRKILIAGVALFIFGPVLGYVLWFAGMYYTARTLPDAVSHVSMFDFGQMLSSVNNRMFGSLVPLLLGMLARALGFFLIIYSLITHFMGTEK
jgi:hypothetical protein